MQATARVTQGIQKMQVYAKLALPAHIKTQQAPQHAPTAQTAMKIAPPDPQVRPCAYAMPGFMLMPALV